MLSKFDLTGAQFNIKLNTTQEKQKSTLGGLLTFLIYSASLAYSIYILILWIQGTLLPRVSSQMRALEGIEIWLPDQFISFNMEMGNYHPFKKNNNFLIPIMMHQTNGQFNLMEAIFSDENTISLPNSTLSHSDSKEYQENTIMFVLTPCNQNLLYNQTCASDEEISKFLQELGTILKIQINLKQYNQRYNKYDEVIKDSYIVIDSGYNLYNQIKLKTTHNSHDSGVLFESYNYETYVHDREISTQPVSTQFARQYFPSGVVPVFVTLISIDPIQTITTIIDPKLGEVLAQIGSIISMMMALSLISSYYNQLILEQQLLHSILIYIYPKLNDVKTKSNIFGEIIQATYKDQTINPQDYASKYKKAKEKLKKYLSISQIIQMIIQIQNCIQLENTWIGEIGSEFDQHFKYKPNQVAVDDNEDCQIQNKVSEIQEIFSR